MRHDTPVPNPSPESLSSILTRVGKLVAAQEEERAALVQTPSPHQGEAQQPLPLLMPTLELTPAPEYIQAEAFLEVSGYFTPSSKRIRGIYSKEKKLREYIDDQGKKRIVKVEINANHKLGLPITSDLDYYRAFLKICDEVVDRDGRFHMPIAVPTSMLIRYAGKQESAKEWKEAKLWLERMTGTLIKGAIYRAKKKNYDDGFMGTVFSQVVVKGQPLRNGQIADTNYVWLSPWFLSNYYYRYTRPINFELYKRLRKPIAKALYTLIEQGWFAADGQPYAKSYHALCEEFLLTPYAALSRIKQQLDPSHHELKQAELLERWEYRRAARGDDYIVIYYPGMQFFDDQKAKDARRSLAEPMETVASSSSASQLDLIARSGLLLADILDTCGDRHNQAAYQKILNDYPEPLIRMALAETHQAHLESRILKNRGAYFTDTLKRLAQLPVTHPS